MTDQTELSLSEAMDKTLTETMATLTADKPAEGAAPVEQADEQKAARARDEAGRFAAQQKAEQKAEAKQAPVEEAVDAGEEAAPAVAAKPAPGSWPKELKDSFGSLPPNVQEYVHRREAEISRTINNYSQKAKFADSVSQVLAPHEAILRADGADPLGAIDGLMQTYQILRNAPPAQKAAAVAQMIQRFGVDLSLVGEDGNAGNSNPHVEQLYSKVAQLEQELAQRRMAEQSYEQEQVSTVIADFARDKPHFEAVKAHMGALLQAGLAKDLNDAYDQACMANPEIRATLLQEQETKRREEAARKADAARKAAAVNVQPRGIQPAAKPVGTMDDTLRDTYRKLVGG